MQLDYLGDKAANTKLINLIQNFWKKRGYEVRAWAEKVENPRSNSHIWVVRTNIKQTLVGVKSSYTVI